MAINLLIVAEAHLTPAALEQADHSLLGCRRFEHDTGHKAGVMPGGLVVPALDVHIDMTPYILLGLLIEVGDQAAPVPRQGWCH